MVMSSTKAVEVSIQAVLPSEKCVGVIGRILAGYRPFAQ
jgi:hypothetical protein